MYPFLRGLKKEKIYVFTFCLPVSSWAHKALLPLFWAYSVILKLNSVYISKYFECKKIYLCVFLIHKSELRHFIFINNLAFLLKPHRNRRHHFGYIEPLKSSYCTYHISKMKKIIITVRHCLETAVGRSHLHFSCFSDLHFT